MKLKFLPIITLFLPLSTLGQGTAVHHTEQATAHQDQTKCILSDAVNGQVLTIHGRVRSEPHDLAFDIPGCDQTVLLTYAGNSDNNVSATQLRNNVELRRFQKYSSSVYKSTGKNICMGCPKYDEVEADLTGTLEIACMPPGATKDKANFIRDGSGKIIGMFGWGHPAPFAGYRLVIQYVSDVKAVKLPRPPS
jgi:hypothetical protein